MANSLWLRKESVMRTPGIFYSGKGTVYICELEACPQCHEPLRVAYTSKFKTVQGMQEVRMIAQRAKCCAHPGCEAFSTIFGSMKWGQIAPVSCTYGYDVIAQIGWQRQVLQQSFATIHTDLRQRLRISESQVRALYHYRYLPLLACHEREQMKHLEIVAKRAGLLLSLDGLAPEGGEPQLWLVRELVSGVTLRCGWMSQQDHAAFVRFLRPIADLGLQVSAVMSDKQSALLSAVAEVFPRAKHAFCQSHYLRNIAVPVAEADEAMKLLLRQDLRTAIGEYIRQEDVEAGGVLTITGGLPSPVDPPARLSAPPPPQEAEKARQAITREICRRIRYLLTLKGRPPFRLAGMEMFVCLSEVKDCLARLIHHHPTPALLTLDQGLQQALQSAQATYALLRETAVWLEHIATLLDPQQNPHHSGDQIRHDLFAFLAHIQSNQFNDPLLRLSFRTLLKTTRNYAPGLFHCYDVPGLPRTNNDREGDFRSLCRRLLRTTGQKGLSLRLLQRQGAWELLPHPQTLLETIHILSHIPLTQFQEERLRMRQHRHRFRLHSRSFNFASHQLAQLEHLWISIPQDSS
jgi:Transposase, Mutator family